MLTLHILAATSFLAAGVIGLLTGYRSALGAAILTGTATISSGTWLLLFTPASLAATCGRGVLVVVSIVLLGQTLKKWQTVNA